MYLLPLYPDLLHFSVLKFQIRNLLPLCRLHGIAAGHFQIRLMIKALQPRFCSLLYPDILQGMYAFLLPDYRQQPVFLHIDLHLLVKCVGKLCRNIGSSAACRILLRVQSFIVFINFDHEDRRLPERLLRLIF